jgi:AcrR family transcriptional regulator
MDNKEIHILNAALKVFAKNGYKNATTRSIASEAGVNESTIFRRFKTKDNLFKNVIEYNREKIGNEIKQCAMNNSLTGDLREKLRYILNSILEIMDNNYDVLHTMISENNNQAVKQEISFFTEAIINFLKPLKSTDSEVNLDILAITIISFLLFVLFEDVIVSVNDKDAVFNEFTEYCVRILQI